VLSGVVIDYCLVSDKAFLLGNKQGKLERRILMAASAGALGSSRGACSQNPRYWMVQTLFAVSPCESPRGGRPYVG